MLAISKNFTAAVTAPPPNVAYLVWYCTSGSLTSDQRNWKAALKRMGNRMKMQSTHRPAAMITIKRAYHAIINNNAEQIGTGCSAA
jgi:hypothetical protein